MRRHLDSLNRAFWCTIALLIFVEITVHAFFRWEHGRFTFSKTPHQVLFEPHPYLVGRLQRSARLESLGRVISATDRHTRWTGAPISHGDLTRIAVLGGSTTFGTGVSDADSWPAMLQESLGVEFAVENYGMPGFSTAEAIIQMALVVPEFEPHIVIFYQGWNDIRNYHMDGAIPDYFTHGLSQYQSLGIIRPDSPAIRSLLQRYLATWWYFEVAVQRWSSREAESSAHSGGPRRDADEEVNRIYARNVETLILLTHHLGAVPVFVPQVLNYESIESAPAALVWTRGIDNSAMRDLMTLMNGITETACKEVHNQPCLYVESFTIDLLDDRHFLDEGHLSKEGGTILASRLVDALGALAPR